ncbi:mRNA splicing protein [Metarhizium acridum]|nr:mRNA splicing protein [Metarhizium acridum]
MRSPDEDTAMIELSTRSFKDLIPLRQRVDAEKIDLSRPDKESVAATTERTKNALAALISGAVAAQRPKNINVGNRNDPTFVRYTPASQMGDDSQKETRIMKIVERQRDPMEPPKFKHKKIPRGPPSPPPPVMHSPPRKLTAQDQEMWKIPPAVSNWKNPKGFTRLAEKEKAQKDENLRALAQKAREERAGGAGGRRHSPDSRDSRSRSGSYSRTDSASDSEDSEIREREKARREKRKEEERKLRQNRMGAERRIQVMAREQNRDISEKMLWGWPSRRSPRRQCTTRDYLISRADLIADFNEDNHYDKPLFAAQDAISSIYRPRANMDDDDPEAGDKEMAKIQKTSRFGEALGKGTFKGAADVEAREGPVQFEKETADPFNVDKFLSEVDQNSSSKRGYGLNDEERQSKRPRVEDEDD